MVRSKQRTKRRRFHGTRFTNNTKQNITKNKAATQQTVCTSARKLKETHISTNDVMEPDNDSNDAACSDSKDLPKTTISNKILKDRADEIARNPNMVSIKEP